MAALVIGEVARFAPAAGLAIGDGAAGGIAVVVEAGDDRFGFALDRDTALAVLDDLTTMMAERGWLS